MDNPLTREDLEHFLDLLPNEPSELVRKDKNFKALALDPADYTTREAVVKLLLEHPKLMQRPIAILGDKAVIARPSEKVLELID